MTSEEIINRLEEIKENQAGLRLEIRSAEQRIKDLNNEKDVLRNQLVDMQGAFHIGDEVKYRGRPNGKHFFVAERYVIDGSCKDYYAAYVCETKNHKQMNGGWLIKHDNLEHV